MEPAEDSNPLALLVPILIDGLVWLPDEPGPRKPKASDISDLAFLLSLQKTGRTETAYLLNKLKYPKKVVLEKARRLINKDLLEGCYCGRCEGHFEPSPEGHALIRDWLARHRNE